MAINFIIHTIAIHLFLQNHKSISIQKCQSIYYTIFFFTTNAYQIITLPMSNYVHKCLSIYLLYTHFF